MTQMRLKNVTVSPRLAGVLALAATLLVNGARVDAQSASAYERGQTKPKNEPKLAFYGPGIVSKVMVEEGQKVKAGEVLAMQSDAEEQAKMLQLQGELVSADLQIRAADADLKQKQVAYQRTKELYADVIAQHKTNSELDAAEVAVTIGEIAVKYRTQDSENKKTEIKGEEIRMNLKKLISPIDGIVAKIDVKEGEGTDLTKPAITVVQNDTLYVEVDVPPTKARALHTGDTLQVSYVDDKETQISAKIVFMTPYASSASGTRKLRLEMENKGNREAGLSVYVKLPDNAAGAAAAAAAR